MIGDRQGVLRVTNRISAVTPRRFVYLDGEPPRLRKDVRRRVRQGQARLAGAGLEPEYRFGSDPREEDVLRWEITAAYEARNAETGRPAGRIPLDELYDRAREVPVLRIDGKLAAWALGTWTWRVYRVLAGQMVPGFGEYYPGRLLEARLVDRCAGDPRWSWLDWGRQHPEALVTVVS
jgi:hypothetical protein